MSRDTSFYYSFLVLPDQQRAAIVTVWDACRAIDDAVDEAPDPAQAARQLAFWRDEIARVFDGGTAQSPQGQALVPVARQFDLPRRSFDDLIDGVQMDLDHRRYETFDDLREYCWRVASTVGLICLNIFGCRHPGGRDYAMNLGLALQLTNIVRDVKTDLDHGRIYLPQDELRRFGCTEQDLAAGLVTPQIRALLQHQLTRARAYYDQAAAAMPAGEARHLVAAEIMGAIYFAILRRIEGRGYDVFHEVIRVPRPERAWIAAATWTKTLLRAGVEALSPARTP
ncbi:MAG: presqualene diphosphate synthase HpnD [Acidobacteria bacterium]|nr:presqualene diphosphate synthase HpnD [Acidobacteriota bacterium]